MSNYVWMSIMIAMDVKYEAKVASSKQIEESRYTLNWESTK